MEHCIICGGIGYYKVDDCPEDFLVVALPKEPHHGPSQKYGHPRCIIRCRGLKNLLALPKSELQRIRICDISKRAMKAIMKQSAEEATSEVSPLGV
jgi:hypothetical protein